MVKTLYQVISILAIANLLCIAGLVVFLAATDRLSAERVDQIAAVLRGEPPVQAAPTTQPTTQPVEAETAETRLARAREETDLASLALERRRREIADRHRLAEALVMDVVRRQEALSSDRSAFEDQQRKIEEERLHEGFVKELALLTSVKPKVRRDMLINKSDADVVKLMMEMDERAGKQVIEACKTKEEKVWISRILHLIQTQQTPTPSAETEAGEQDAQ
ncbi:MAG: hypothetical protein JSU68_00080 [Phycisphaerales bacterium]|nr:MAG: hypothetical protein JSU68_00080 [Phycisphaerales bacterium]